MTLYDYSFGTMLRLSDERSSANNARQYPVSPLDNAVAGIADNTWYWVTISQSKAEPEPLTCMTLLSPGRDSKLHRSVQSYVRAYRLETIGDAARDWKRELHGRLDRRFHLPELPPAAQP